MDIKKKFLTVAAAGLVAAAGASLVADKADAKKDDVEKCYGVAKAGKNDCGGKDHSCAGHSTKDGATDTFIVVPKGLCDRLVNGSTEAS